MAKKTYKDLKDGDTVYIVDGVEVFDEYTIKIKEVLYPNMDEDDEKLQYVLELFNQDGTKYKYHWTQSVEKFKNATNTNNYEIWNELWGLICFFNREDAVGYYKKIIKDLVEDLDETIEKLDKRRSDYIELLNSFE